MKDEMYFNNNDEDLDANQNYDQKNFLTVNLLSNDFVEDILIEDAFEELERLKQRNKIEPKRRRKSEDLSIDKLN